MKKHFIIPIIFLVALAASPIANAQTYFVDTVWTKRTDQNSGFYQVKFSNNDLIIVGHGYEMDIFYSAINGEEINRIPGNTEVIFYNNDNNFLKLNKLRNCFELFDAKLYIVIDTLENDGTQLIQHYALSNDESRLVCVKEDGLKIWDMVSKKIIISKDFQTVPNLIKTDYGNISFSCDDSKILIGIDKTYQISDTPPKQTVVSFIEIFNSNTTDSIGAFNGFSYFTLSHDCQKIAFQVANDKNGVAIYNYNTNKQIRVIPINGFSLTGIEFSPDDKYIVTSNGPGANSLIVWDVVTGVEQYKYTETSFSNIDVSNDGKKIIISVGRYLDLIKTKFITSIIDNQDNSPFLFPNPTTGELLLHSSLEHIEKILIFDMKGNEYQQNGREVSSDGNIRIDVSTLTSGKYIIKIQGQNQIQTYNFIINK